MYCAISYTENADSFLYLTCLCLLPFLCQDLYLSRANPVLIAMQPRFGKSGNTLCHPEPDSPAGEHGKFKPFPYTIKMFLKATRMQFHKVKKS
jgi:hypothetical protein